MAELALDSEIVEMTPTVAREIIASNSRNRSLRRDYVRTLAGAMERGEWAVNGEPVQIAVDGTLLNGQHRLEAVIESGVTVPLLVVRGLPLSAQRTMDSGTRRNLSDVLALHGESDTTNLAAMLTLLHRYRVKARLDNSSRTAPTATEALELLEREPAIRDRLVIARRVHRATRMRVSVAAVLSYLFDEADPGEGENFFAELCRPIDELPSASPVRALRSILDRNRSERTYRLSTYILSGMTIKAFNAWREGRDLTLLSFRAGGGAQEPFPKIYERPA